MKDELKQTYLGVAHNKQGIQLRENDASMRFTLHLDAFRIPWSSKVDAIAHGQMRSYTPVTPGLPLVYHQLATNLYM